jgi:hypothetical protein
MTDQHFEELAKRWPDLFQKSGDFEFSINEGWYGIIDILCSMLSYRVENAKARLKYAMENPDAKFVKPIATLEKDVVDAIKELPVIAQVKEKFGTLRFYVDGGTPEMHNYIEFAEAMTSITCEVCGNPGTSRTGGWIRVLCDTHSREQDERNLEDQRSIPKMKSVKLSDED